LPPLCTRPCKESGLAAPCGCDCEQREPQPQRVHPHPRTTRHRSASPLASRPPSGSMPLDTMHSPPCRTFERSTRTRKHAENRRSTQGWSTRRATAQPTAATALVGVEVEQFNKLDALKSSTTCKPRAWLVGGAASITNVGMLMATSSPVDDRLGTEYLGLSLQHPVSLPSASTRRAGCFPAGYSLCERSASPRALQPGSQVFAFNM